MSGGSGGSGMRSDEGEDVMTRFSRTWRLDSKRGLVLSCVTKFPLVAVGVQDGEVMTETLGSEDTAHS